MDNIFAANHKHKLLINKGEISAGEACEDEYHSNDGFQWDLYEQSFRILGSTWSSHMEAITAGKYTQSLEMLSKPRIIIDHRITR